MNTRLDALAADLKRQILSPPPEDPHQHSATLIVAISEAEGLEIQYVNLYNEFTSLVQDEQNDPDKVYRDLLFQIANYELGPIAMPPRRTLAEAREAKSILSSAIAAVRHRISALKRDQTEWASTPLDQREWQINRASAMFYLGNPPPEAKEAVWSAARRSLAAGYHEPKHVERDKLRARQQADTARAMNPPMATGILRGRSPAAVSHGVPDARRAKPLPAMSNAVVIGTSGEAFARGEGLGDILNSRPIR
jgi:hypothetical protein